MRKKRSGFRIVIAKHYIARRKITEFFGGDASGGNTRSHPEHDG